MSYLQDMSWFKQLFNSRIQTSVQDTPFTPDLLTAIAMQETGYIWGRLYPYMSVDDVLKNCVGDTLDEPQGRGAFPRDKSDLLSQSNGERMFNIARKALESMAVYIPEYRADAADSDAFCHGFGVFQYDLQFFLENPEFFLEKRWYEFDECLKIAIEELKAALQRAYGSSKTTLTDEELVYVAIAYNQGSVNVDGGFTQGYFDGQRYYGEYIWEYLQFSKSIEVTTEESNLVENDPNSVGSVAAWQNILNGCGYLPTLRITGAFPLDETTIATTKRFQKNLALPETGVIDLETWRAGLRHTKLPDWVAVTPQLLLLRGRANPQGKHVIDYVRQPDAYTCQSACIATVLGKTNESDVYEIRDELEQIGVPGDPTVMGQYLRPRVQSYQFLVDGSLEDAKSALADGCVVITHGWLTKSGHVICLVGFEPDPNTYSYCFVVEDPWAEFDFPNAAYTSKSGRNIRYSSYGIYAYCVASSSYQHATELYANRTLDSSQKGAWLHIIKI
jgi:Putative peptidoglycan binding domain